jgi:O-antigen chain-terminating methyltransferase
MDVQKIVSEIHARVRQEGNPQPPPLTAFSPPAQRPAASPQDASELNALRSTYRRLYQNRNAVGKMPPSPNTLRARIGGILVRGVQHCLFWYTPQILQFHNDATSALNNVCNLIGSQSDRITSLSRQVQRLRRETLDGVRDLVSLESEKTASLEREFEQLRREISEAGNGGHSERTLSLEQEVQRLRREIANFKVDVPRPAAGNIEFGLPNSFQFALQDRFRGSEAETAAKLQVYLENLKPLLPALPKAQWLDLGCGRGEWLEVGSQLGCPILGLDSNPASVLRCREKQLNVEERDALTHLRSLPDRSAAVISAFHVVEHWPMHYTVALVEEVARVLQPGGLLMIETPNPDNLLMGSANFWNDPTHRQPVPPKLLEFLYEYYGLTVVKRLELNPLPKEQRFAFDEISVVHRLNDYFYGPQDYGLIGRR